MTYTPKAGSPVSKLLILDLTASAAAHSAGPVAKLGTVNVTTGAGARSLALKFHVSEQATAKLVLRVPGGPPFSDSFPVKPGQNSVTVALPRWVKAGKASVLLVVTDARNKTRRYRTTVSVPA